MYVINGYSGNHNKVMQAACDNAHQVYTKFLKSHAAGFRIEKTVVVEIRKTDNLCSWNLYYINSRNECVYDDIGATYINGDKNNLDYYTIGERIIADKVTFSKEKNR